MDLDDIFIDESKRKLPELVELRIKKGWTQYQMALALNLSIIDYSDIEYGRVKDAEVIARAKKILESNDGFNPLFFLPKPPAFESECQYKFVKQHIIWNGKGDKEGKSSSLTFVKAAKGDHGLTHYLFKNKGGSLESFTQLQLMDYRLVKLGECKIVQKQEQKQEPEQQEYDPQELLTVEQVAEKIHYSKNNVFSLTSRNKFPRGIKIGHRCYWKPETIDQWLQEKQRRKSEIEQQTQDLLNASQVAEQLGYTRNHIFVLVRDGKLPRGMMIEGRHYWKSEVIEQWLQERHKKRG